MSGRLTTILALGVLLCGCAGQGDGWVTGQLWLENCRAGETLGEAPSKMSDFDLEADFFAAETLEDSNASINQRRNGLNFRIQDTSNWIENSNGLVLQLLDLRGIAHYFARGEPVPVTYRSPLAAGSAGTATADDLIRSRLYLYAKCPECRQPKVAASNEMKLSSAASGSSSATSGVDCFVPTGKEAAPCPTLSATQRTALDKVCQGDFNDKENQASIVHLLGRSGACIFFCQLGAARRGQNPDDLDEFKVDYGDTLAGFFSFNIRDGRSLKLGHCARAQGNLQGMFSFEVSRNRVAQSFP